MVVVDDGSADDTAARAAAAGAEVLRHAENRGKGAALVTGLRHLAAAGVERALTLDADGQHLPDQIPVLLAAADAAPEAIVVGVRRKEGFADQARRALRQLDRRPADARHRRPAAAGHAVRLPRVSGRRRPSRSARAARASTSRPRSCCGPRAPAWPCVGVPVEVYYPPVAERVSHYRPWADTLRIIRSVVRVIVARDSGAGGLLCPTAELRLRDAS